MKKKTSGVLYIRSGESVDWDRLANPDLDHLEVAKKSGDYGPLAEHILAGGTLHEETREWLARHLLGGTPSKRDGRRKDPKTALEEWHLFERVVRKIHDEGYSKTKALEEYADERDESIDTVKTRMRRAIKRFGSIQMGKTGSEPDS